MSLFPQIMVAISLYPQTLMAEALSIMHTQSHTSIPTARGMMATLIRANGAEYALELTWHSLRVPGCIKPGSDQVAEAAFM